MSIATVSRVLNSPELVRDETRLRVMEVIDALGYVPSADATARARKGVGRVGILVPFFTQPSFIQRMRGVAAALFSTSFELIIYPVNSLERLESYLAQLPVSRRLDGLIIMSLPLDEIAARRLIANHLETILIEVSHSAFSNIQIDNFRGGQLAAEFLLAKGHQRCAFFGSGGLPDYSLHPEDIRLQGFRSALVAHGLTLLDEFIKYPNLTACEVSQEFRQLMDSPSPPTAIFAASDSLAIRVLRAAREFGVHVPRDLSVIGFDDIDMSDQIGLTTISQSLDESGKMAVELLLARIANPNKPIQTVYLYLQVAERETA